MPVFIALLKGVNVGKAKRVPMAELRALLADLGYTQVQTLLNSGNAVFGAARGTPASLAAAIGKGLAERLQVEAPVIVVPAAQLAAIVAECPLVVPEDRHSQFVVAFGPDTATLQALTAVQALVQPPETFAVGAHAAYLLCANGILESKAGAALVGKPGAKVTTRNWATVCKLRDLSAAVS